MTSQKIVISAPGKVILHGEHSVVYGKLAIAASINKTTTLQLSHEGTKSCSLTLNFTKINFKLQVIINEDQLPLHKTYNFNNPENVRYEELVNQINTYIEKHIKFDCEDKKTEVAQKNALLAFLYLYYAMILPAELALDGLRVDIESDLPVGAGLGSSASFSVCIAGAFLELLKTKFKKSEFKTKNGYEVLNNEKFKLGDFTPEEKDLISRWAFEAERVMHGNPSGLDNTVCTFGGFVEYRKLSAPKNLNITSSDRFKCLLIDTNVPKNTRAQVEKVAKLKGKFPDLVDKILDAMEEISKMATGALQKLSTCTENADYYDLNTLIDVNQNMLRSLGVSTFEIDNVCSTLAKFNLHAKITGAGGGGYVLCLIPLNTSDETISEAKRALETAGCTCDCLNLGAEGVHLLKK